MYETWDLTMPLVPQCSHFYPLEPIGIGTPYSESLASYVNRLAIAHCVSPKTLITQEILAWLGKLDQLEFKNRGAAYLYDLWSKNAPSLNGGSQWARDYVHTLETLTSFRGLRSLTMLTWSGVISQRMLLRRTQAWCPKCYDEWRESNQIIYNPLIWSLQAVKICPRHYQNLQLICPHKECQRSVRFLALVSRPGYCPHCQGWLGSALSKDVKCEESVEAEERKRLCWDANAVGDLIAKAPDIPISPPKENIIFAVKRCSELIAQESIASLARKLDIEGGMVWAWQNGSEIPQLAPLLKICFRLRLPLYSFLMAENFLLSPTHSPQEKILSPFVVKDYKRLSNADLQHQLGKVLLVNTYPPPSLKEVITQLGYSSRSCSHISQRAPELCQAIVTRYQQWHTSSKRIKRPHHEHLRTEQLKKILEDFLISEELPPLSVPEIAKRLGYRSHKDFNRRFPDLCRAINAKYFEYQEKLIAKYKEALEGSLTYNNGVTPSVAEIARQVNCPRKFLAERFPELCHSITLRRREQLNAQRRQALEDAINNNPIPPPSLEQIAKQLGISADCLRRCAPDLCNIIVERYRNYVNAQKMERSQKIVGDIKQWALYLHAQGIHPASKQIESLTRPGYLRESQAFNAWHEVLNELGLE